jgi:hypothetical protein
VAWHHDVVDADDLYGLPMDEFVPTRNALARELRNAGQRDKAAQVAELRKPSVAAWAVNQLVRTQRRAVAELLEAGDGLRTAQDDVLAGRGDARSLRIAVERERTAVDALTDAARGLLSSEGQELSDAMLGRVSDTLHAAAFDDEAREQVRDGRLERELRHIGLGTAAFGGGSTTTVPARPAPKKSSSDTRSSRGSDATKSRATERAGDRATERAARAERERAERERAQARADARAAEREARRRAERAGRGAKLALERRDKAAEALREAEGGLDAAEAEVRVADDALQAAEAAVREANR